MTKLCDKDKCTGCLACYNACNHDAISIISDGEGFLIPSIDTSKCVGCNLCVRSCPVLSFIDHPRLSSIEAYAAWQHDYDIVRNSSSGGVFTAIAQWVLKKQGVVYGAAFDKNLKVSHIGVDDVNELHLLQQSKYVQSNVGKSFYQTKQYLKEGRWVLYTGTPCQIAGLNNYLGVKLDKSKLLTLDVVCHGVPTPLVFEDYKKHLEQKHSARLINFSFRDKKWSWLHFNVKATFSNGKEYYGTWEADPFMRGFLREYFLRPSCHQCKYASLERPGDLSIADFWCYKHQRQEEQNKDRGINAVLVNTVQGKIVFDEIKKDLFAYQKPIDEPVRTNQALRGCFPPSPKRVDFWKDYKMYGFEYLIPKYLYPEKMGLGLKILYGLGKKPYYIYNGIVRILTKITKKS